MALTAERVRQLLRWGATMKPAPRPLTPADPTELNLALDATVLRPPGRPVTAADAPPPAPEPTLGQADVNYRDGTDEESCANCVMFVPPAGCTLVMGTIRPDGVCDRWSPLPGT